MSDLEISWELVKETLGNDLNDFISEGIGPDAFDGKNYLAQWNNHCATLFELIKSGDDQQLGEVVREVLGGYLSKRAVSIINVRANVELELDSFKSALNEETEFHKNQLPEVA